MIYLAAIWLGDGLFVGLGVFAGAILTAEEHWRRVRTKLASRAMRAKQ